MVLSLIIAANFEGALYGGIVGLLFYYFMCIIVVDKKVFGGT